MNPTLLTFTGRTIDMLDPKPSDIVLEDIAHCLAVQARFNGHFAGWHYSVAEHSVHVADLLRGWGEPTDVQRAGLMHDAAEAYVGDLIGPMKKALRALAGGPSGFDEIERRWSLAIGGRFGVALEPMSDSVKLADLAQFAQEDFELRGVPIPGLFSGRPVQSMGPSCAMEFFVDAAERLGVR